MLARVTKRSGSQAGETPGPTAMSRAGTSSWGVGAGLSLCLRLHVLCALQMQSGRGGRAQGRAPAPGWAVQPAGATAPAVRVTVPGPAASARWRSALLFTRGAGLMSKACPLSGLHCHRVTRACLPTPW